jgi:surface protein
LEGDVRDATNEIKNNLTENNSNFFEAQLLLALDSLKKKNYKKSKDHLKQSYAFMNNDRISQLIVETLEQYLYVFEENKIPNTEKNFGNLSFINEVFQRCYLNDKDTKKYFDKIINNKNDGDYSRYIFFYINYLIENNRYDEAREVADSIDYLNSSLLISQGKKWIDDQKLKEFNKIFSCRNSNDIVSEFLFSIASLYSSQYNYEQSNFYLNISHYLNPKFQFNLSLMVENYYYNEDYSNTSKILKSFNDKADFYHWFKIKKEAQIILRKKDADISLKFINSKFNGDISIWDTSRVTDM